MTHNLPRVMALQKGAFLKMRTQVRTILTAFCLLGTLPPAGCNRIEADSLSIPGSTSGLSEAVPGNTQLSTVWLADGKNETIQVDLFPAKTPLDNYRENMALIHPWDFGRAHHENDLTRTKLGSPEVTCIGKWNECVVYDLSDHVNKCKQIMLRDRSGNHKIIYSQLPWCTCGVEDLPRIIEIQGTSVLAYRTRVPGTGHYFMGFYFVYDTQKNVPVLIDTSGIRKSLSRVLPKDHSVCRGPGFDIETMTCSIYVHYKSDCLSGPTGGTVDLKLVLHDARLLVVEEKYTPAPEEPRLPHPESTSSESPENTRQELWTTDGPGYQRLLLQSRYILFLMLWV